MGISAPVGAFRIPMPYDKVKDHPDCPATKSIGVVKESDGELLGCHATEESADDQIAALYAAEEEERMKVSAVTRMKADSGIVSTIRDAIAALQDGFSRLFPSITREWDGSASNYDSTESYCSACLLDVNQGDEKTQDHCMLPVKAPGSDSYDFEGIQAAAGGHGISQVSKPDDVPQDEWDAAVKSAANTIISQYGENDKTAPDSVYEAAGKEPPAKEETRAIGMGQIYSMVDSALYAMESWPWLLDLYLENGEMFVVATTGGKLYRYAVEVDGSDVTLGEGQEVEPMFQPVGESEIPRSRTTVWREAGGAWRWLSISCTAILNRVGEIDSRALFDSMVAHAEETGEYPYRTFYHCGEALKYGQADYLARDGFVFITSGLFDTEGENADLALAEIEARQADPETWGESIGYKPTEPPVFVPVAEGIEVLAFDAGECREISCCLEADAAALFTQSETQEVSRMRDKIKSALEKLGLSTERIDEFEKKVDETNRSIPEQGLIARSTEPGPEGDDEVKTPGEGVDAPSDTDEAQPPVELEIGEEVIENVAAVALGRLFDEKSPVMETLAEITGSIESMRATTKESIESMQGATEKALGMLDQRIAALEGDEEAKRERWLEDLPRKHPVARLSYRPRAAHAKPDEEKPPEGEPEDYASQAEEVVSGIKAAY